LADNDGYLGNKQALGGVLFDHRHDEVANGQLQVPHLTARQTDARTYKHTNRQAIASYNYH